MSKHISEDGQVRECKAQSPDTCTAKGPNGERAEHFDNTESARQRSEELQEEKYGRNSTLSKKCPLSKEGNSYTDKDTAVKEAEKILAQYKNLPEKSIQYAAGIGVLTGKDKVSNNPETIRRYNDLLPEKYKNENPTKENVLNSLKSALKDEQNMPKDKVIQYSAGIGVLTGNDKVSRSPETIKRYNDLLPEKYKNENPTKENVLNSLKSALKEEQETNTIDEKI